MTERNQLVRPLRRHDAGDTRDAEHIALLRVAGLDQLQRRLAHDDAAFGDRGPFSGGLLGHVDHAGFAAGIDMGEGAAFEGLPRHQRAPMEPSASLRASSALVAAATSACRIRLSPTRKVDMPTCASRDRSDGAKMPLSPMITRSLGISGASASLVASVVSKVRRLRLLTPIIGERSLSARSSSARSWISIRTSMPYAMAACSISLAAASSRAAMIIRMQSAPWARASTT